MSLPSHAFEPPPLCHHHLRVVNMGDALPKFLLGNHCLKLRRLYLHCLFDAGNKGEALTMPFNHHNNGPPLRSSALFPR